MASSRHRGNIPAEVAEQLILDWVDGGSDMEVQELQEEHHDVHPNEELVVDDALVVPKICLHVQIAPQTMRCKKSKAKLKNHSMVRNYTFATMENIYPKVNISGLPLDQPSIFMNWTPIVVVSS